MAVQPLGAPAPEGTEQLRANLPMRLGRHVFFRRQLTGKNPLHPRGLTNPASPSVRPPSSVLRRQSSVIRPPSSAVIRPPSVLRPPSSDFSLEKLVSVF